MSALKFQKVARRYTAQRNDHLYEIERVEGGWQLRHCSVAAYLRGTDPEPIAGLAPKLATAKHLAVQHLSSNV